ncbi:NYN domain-containing protein, partial [Thermococcus sp. LS2]|uniref:NYN domain-containing protein n=1 Tax=Thermococcus sp. LS2 TaxID=1638260 RepID=UPI00143AB20B
FLPVVNEAKSKGKETVVIGAEPGFSKALQNAADYVIILGRSLLNSTAHHVRLLKNDKTMPNHMRSPGKK